MPENFSSDNRISDPGIFKTAVIDIGSNSVRLVVFQGLKRSPDYFYNEKVICKLGLGVKKEGFLNQEGVKMARKAIIRFSHLIIKMKINLTVGVATAAVRHARDGASFLNSLMDDTGISFKVLTGKQEAEYAGRGVLFGWPNAHGLICDIGGLSLEFCEISKGKILNAQSTDLGPLAFGEKVREIAKRKYITKSLSKIEARLVKKNKSVFLVGGAWRALAKIDMELRGYPLKILHEYRMRSIEVQRTARWCLKQSEEEIIKKTGISKTRAYATKHASEIILELIKIFKPDKFFVSSYGLREGILFEKMDKHYRDKDPLIEASLDYEARSARFPGFGVELYDWVLPIFSKITKVEKRLILSACLLHDTIWSAHPDYRSELCVETVTRANMGGVDHTGRLFLGLALAYRYKGGKEISEHPAFKLLRQRDKEKAIVLGKAIRLGALLSGSALGGLKKADIEIIEKYIVLKIDKDLKTLAGGIVKKRLSSLGDALNLVPKLVIEKV